jgi:hypothetical protein
MNRDDAKDAKMKNGNTASKGSAVTALLGRLFALVTALFVLVFASFASSRF